MGQVPDDPALSNAVGEEAIADSSLTVTAMGRKKEKARDRDIWRWV